MYVKLIAASMRLLLIFLALIRCGGCASNYREDNWQSGVRADARRQPFLGAPWHYFRIGYEARSIPGETPPDILVELPDNNGAVSLKGIRADQVEKSIAHGHVKNYWAGLQFSENANYNICWPSAVVYSNSELEFVFVDGKLVYFQADEPAPSKDIHEATFWDHLHKSSFTFPLNENNILQLFGRPTETAKRLSL